MANWPNPPLLDDFNRANESPLSDGGKWSLWPASGVAQLDLVSNVAQLTTSAGPCVELWTDSPFGPDAAASISLTSWYTLVGQGAEWRVYLSGHLAAPAYSYSVEYGIQHDGTPGYLHLRRQVDNAWFKNCTLVGLPATTSAGDQLGLGVNGRTIEAWYNAGGSWVLIDTADDAVLSGGAAALGAGYAGAGGNLSSGLATQVTFDNFHAGPYLQRPYNLPLLGAG